jgi:hypothetical protein
VIAPQQDKSRPQQRGQRTRRPFGSV